MAVLEGRRTVSRGPVSLSGLVGCGWRASRMTSAPMRSALKIRSTPDPAWPCSRLTFISRASRSKRDARWRASGFVFELGMPITKSNSSFGGKNQNFTVLMPSGECIRLAGE